MSYKDLTIHQQVEHLEQHFVTLFQAVSGMHLKNEEAIGAYLAHRTRLYKGRNLQFLYGRRDVLEQLMAIIEARGTDHGH